MYTICTSLHSNLYQINMTITYGNAGGRSNPASAETSSESIEKATSLHILRIEVEQIDNNNVDRWFGEFTSQCKLISVD